MACRALSSSIDSISQQSQYPSFFSMACTAAGEPCALDINAAGGLGRRNA
jgi:hypothetical protein